jgi:hypothetical protein
MDVFGEVAILDVYFVNDMYVILDIGLSRQIGP